MGMWIVILLTTLAVAGGSFIYLISRFYKFPYTYKFGHDKKRLRLLLAAAPVALIILSTVIFMDTMNMMVIVIALALIWLFCDLVAWIVGKITRAGRKGDAADPEAAEGKRERIRRLYPAGICALIITFLYFLCGWILAHHVWETDYLLYTGKTENPLRIVMFADLHMGTTLDETGFAKQIQKINEAHPDVVVIAGDLVDDSTSYAEMAAACKALGTLETKYGVFYAYGNHDKGYSSGGRGYGYQELEAELIANGVVILEDAAYDLNQEYTLIGRADASTGRSAGGYEMGAREEIATLMDEIPKDRYTIVIDHQPNDYDAEAAAGADLVLSGHTHGGQLIPITKVGEWIGANDATYGYERREHTDFIVTSGISAWSILFKTGCKSEYVNIRIVPERR